LVGCHIDAVIAAFGEGGGRSERSRQPL